MTCTRLPEIPSPSHCTFGSGANGKKRIASMSTLTLTPSGAASGPWVQRLLVPSLYAPTHGPVRAIFRPL